MEEEKKPPKKTKSEIKEESTPKFDWEDFEKRRSQRRNRRSNYSRSSNPRQEIIVQKIAELKEEKKGEPEEKGRWQKIGKKTKTLLYFSIPVGLILLYMRYKYGKTE